MYAYILYTVCAKCMYVGPKCMHAVCSSADQRELENEEHSLEMILSCERERSALAVYLM